MADPEYLNDFQQGSVPVQGQSRADRLKAAGVDPGESMADYHKRQRDAAWAESGSQEDAGAEFQRVSSKQGRRNVEMPDSNIHEQVRELAKKGGRPLHPETELPVEPVTEKSIVGYSEEKKAALAKAKKSSRKKSKGD